VLTYIIIALWGTFIVLIAWELLRRSRKDKGIPVPYNLDLYDRMVAQGYVSERTHPDDPDLFILNYTPKTQFERLWNDVTLQCRGLIVKDGKIVARPFIKFFNLGELDKIPSGPFVAQAKMDGSLGIIYPAPDGLPAVATRGSFDSEQAQWATSWLRADPKMIDVAKAYFAKGATPLVEIIYPENRIVVDYKGRMSLTFLTAIDNRTGKDVSFDGDEFVWPDDTADRLEHASVEDVQALADNDKGEESEGYVLLWANGTRAKVKGEDYVRLHRVLTGVTPRKIHEMLMSNMGIDRLAEFVPDEFYSWMRSIANDLEAEFSRIEKEALAVLNQVDLDADRKTQAEFINTQPNSGLVFRMLDGKPYAEQIWKMIRPSGQAFRTDIDA
jgi:hypothetical protein